MLYMHTRTHTYMDAYIHTYLYAYIYTQMYAYINMSLQGFCLSSWGFFSGGFFRVFFAQKVLSRVVLVRSPSVRIYIRYNRKLSITFNFKFHMYDKTFKSMTSPAFDSPPFRNC